MKHQQIEKSLAKIVGDFYKGKSKVKQGNVNTIKS